MDFKISELDENAMKLTKTHINNLAIPLGSLGKLDDILIKCAGIFETDDFDFNKKCTVVMCADNGVVAQNISQTGQKITKIVAENMTSDKATISILSKNSNADLFVIDIGMATDSENEQIINRKIMYGTNDFSKTTAMTREQVISAIEVGIEMVKTLKNQHYSLIATGEMGIGNTTTSSAIIATLLGKTAQEVTGRGAGLSTDGLVRKIHLIDNALAFHKPTNADMIDVLSKIGGLDIAGLVGIFLGGAIYRVPILIDGFISSTAALIATKIDLKSRDFMFATHISAEPAGKMVLDALDLMPFLHLDMRLGEGTGAVMAFGIFDLANKIYRKMSNFEDINIEKYVPLS
ncbi:MAG: nicotinate-nucleotide--dimethylbenzimidazole phosphoribosyltransferase [Clostridia bacterium]